MKKHSFKIRTTLVGLLATIVTLGVSVPAMANRKKHILSNIETTQPSVVFLGNEKNNSLFSISFNNNTPVKFDLLIKDAEGEVIFNQTYESSRFAKVFKLVNEDPYSNPTGLSFHIQVKPSGAEHSFEVSSETTMVNEVQVVKL